MLAGATRRVRQCCLGSANTALARPHPPSRHCSTLHFSPRYLVSPRHNPLTRPFLAHFGLSHPAALNAHLSFHPNWFTSSLQPARCRGNPLTLWTLRNEAIVPLRPFDLACHFLVRCAGLDPLSGHDGWPRFLVSPLSLLTSRGRLLGTTLWLHNTFCSLLLWIENVPEP